MMILVCTFGCLLMAGDKSSWDYDVRTPARFAQGPAMFKKVRDLLLHDYYRSDLDEDTLYRAAVQGLLQNADNAMSSWNKLLTPAEYAEMKGDVTGKIVGVGLNIKFDPDTGYAKVVSVIPDSPAEKAELRAGDSILEVDGKLFKGKSLREVVYAIRGQAGESRRLTVLRDAELRHVKLRLSAVAWAVAESEVLPGGIGRVTVRYFTEATPKLLRAALEKLKRQNVRALVVDLRGNEGGILDSAVDSAGLFLPADSAVVTLHERAGKTETLRTKGAPVLGKLPLAVLVDESTACGAEILASALREDAGAVLIGATTKGKGSVQRIDELPNGYAVKYTIATFTTPGGVDFAGHGLAPDMRVNPEPSDPDAPVRTAAHWLQARG